MRLSQNFTLDELCKSQTAERKGIPNLPDTDQIGALEDLCKNILQPIRDEFGSFMVSAADFEVAGVDNYDLARWIEGNLPFDQLILECYQGGNSGWVHCSYAEDGRRETLTYSKARGYRQGLLKDG